MRAHLLLALGLALCRLTQQQQSSRSFAVDLRRDAFVKDGEPFRMLGGSLHYFRVPRVYWRDRLRKIRAAGLNTVSTYVEWSLHESQPGRVDFSGELDLLHFIDLAQEEGLLVNLRVGPYICAERDMGGLPPWLLAVKPDISLRSSDPVFKYYTKRWLETLLPLVRSRLYGNGGPIILVQVENEYGSYPACDFAYLKWLRDVMRLHVGSAAVLYTTDGAALSYLKCGKIPGVYATVDFGSGTQNVTAAFVSQRAKEPHGPLVNSEYYPGWLTHWGEALQTTDTQAVVRTLQSMLDIGANINFYVFVGGSNFGFTSGANYGSAYSAQITSYDYNAPITEAGDPTDKYFAIREMIGRYVPLPPLPRPAPAPKASLGPFMLQRILDVSSLRSRAPVRARYPYDFEQLARQASGFVLYETTVPPVPALPYTASNLSAPALRDRAIVLVDNERVGTLCRSAHHTWMPVGAQAGQKLSIFVENQGRINYGKYLNDSKGLGNVTLNGITLTDWVMTGYPLDNGTALLQQVLRQATSRQSLPQQQDHPAVYLASFQLPPDNTTALPLDSFLDTSNWGKGVAYLNGFNLGRYWPEAGPQVTLYVPGYLFKPHPRTNHLLLVELDRIPSIPHVSFIDHPVLNGQVRQIC